MRLFYLSDGLCADADEEAFGESARVPAHEVLGASDAVRYWLQHKGCPWTIRSVRRMQEMLGEA